MNKNFTSEDGRSTQRELRRKVLERLGNRCAWPDCHITDPDMLQIDHIDGGGNREARSLGRYWMLIKMLRMNNPEKEYQVLCANHNMKKYVHDIDYEPHDEEESRIYTPYYHHTRLYRTFDNTETFDSLEEDFALVESYFQ